MSRRNPTKRLADLDVDTARPDALTQPHILAFLLAELKDPRPVHNLVTRFATWDDFVDADAADVLATAGNAALKVRAATAPPLDIPVATRTTTRYDHHYPQTLLDLGQPPVLLYSTGDLPHGPALAIIGPLYATNDAAAFARDAAASAAVRNIPVVAVLDDTGVGAAALERTCDLGGLPIAVTSGDVSSSHLRSELAARVRKAGGVCVSDTNPKQPWSAVHSMVAGSLAVGYAAAAVACDPGLHPGGGSVGVRTAVTTGRPLIVPRPPALVTTASLGTHVLTHPKAFTPELFGTNDDYSARVAAGLPAAPYVPESSAEIDDCIAALFGQA